MVKSAFQIMDLKDPDYPDLELNYPDFINNELSGFFRIGYNPDFITSFRAFFEKSVFLENGHNRHQMVAMLIH